MRYLRGTVAPRKAPCGLGVGNWNEAVVPAIVPMASSFKGNSASGVRRRDMMTGGQESASPEVRHRHREIHPRVNKFAQNLHVLKMAVEAVKESLDTCSKQVRFFVLHRLRGKVRHVCQCLCVLQ